MHRTLFPFLLSLYSCNSLALFSRQRILVLNLPDSLVRLTGSLDTEIHLVATVREYQSLKEAVPLLPVLCFLRFKVRCYCRFMYFCSIALRSWACSFRHILVYAPIRLISNPLASD